MKWCYVLPDPMSYRSWEEFVTDLKLMKRLGYDAVELQIADPAQQNESQLKRALEKVEFNLVAVQTGGTYALRGNCLCAADTSVRSRTVDLLRSFVDFAQRFGSVIVFGSLQGKASDEKNLDIGRRRILEAITDVAQYATRRGVIVAFEPVNHLEVAYHHTIDAVHRIVREINLSGLQMMVDTFHMNIEEKSMFDSLSGIKDVLKHVHLSETNRNILGHGHWDTKSFLQELENIGYSNYCSIGVYNTRLSRRESMRRCMDTVNIIKKELEGL